MKIGIDATTAIQKLGGISEYSYNLINALAKIDQKNQYLLVNFAYFRKNLRTFPKLPANFTMRNINIPNKIMDFFWRNLHFPKLDYFLPGCDVIFKPHFQLPPLQNKNLVFTVCDLSFYHFPGWFTENDQKRFFIDLKTNIPKAKKIIAISQNTKGDLIKIFHLDLKEIVVTHLAVSDTFKQKINSELQKKILQKYKIKQPYILYLGTLEPRKNLLTLIDAFYSLSKKFPHLNLILAGRNGWLYEEIFQKVDNLDLTKKVIFTGPVGDDERPAIYKGAEIFVYPSLYEGFGLPPLEAMACGVPVISSNASSLPEVVGKAAILIDPRKYQQIYQAMKDVLTNKKFKLQLSKKAKVQAKRFSWEKCARETLKVLEGVAKEK